MKKISTNTAPAAIGPYSQGIMAGSLVFASGQIPVVPATGEIAGDTIETQAEQSCLNVAEVLKAADQLEWVRRMNSIWNRAEEFVSQALIYTD